MNKLKSIKLYMEEKNYLNVAIFFYFLPLALVSGALIAEIFCSIIAINFIYKSIKFKLTKYYLNIFTYLFLMFYFYLVMRSIFVEELLFSLKTSFFYIRFLFFSLGVWYILDHIPNAKENFGKILLFTVFFVLLGLYIEYFLGQSLFGYNNLIPSRLYSFFGTEPIVGSYLTRLLPLIYLFVLFLNIFHLKQNKHIFFSIVFLSLLNLGIFLSGERTSFVFAILIFFIIFFFTKKFLKLKVILLFFSLILIGLSLNFDERVKSRMIDFTKLQISKKTEKIEENIKSYPNLNPNLFKIGLERKKIASKIPSFGNYYSSLYYSGYLMFKDNIWFGQGPKMFRKLCNSEKFIVLRGCSNHPHNTYIQVLAEIGLIGLFFPLILFLLLLIVFINQFIKLMFEFFFKKKQLLLSDEFICLLGALFITLFPFSPNGNFFNNWLCIIYYLPIGFILHYYFDFLKKNESIK